jgi:hypothetical protein
VENVTTMADLDELALAMPQTTKEVRDDGRPVYLVHGKFFCCHRERRRDAVNPDTGERLDDVLIFRVADLGAKELLLSDARGVFFTTPHFVGYPAVLLRIPDLAHLDRDELHDLVAEAWLTRAQKRVAKAWLAEHEVEDGRSPRPHTAGCTQNRSSSTRPCPSRLRASSPHPTEMRSPSSSSFSLVTASARSPSIRLAFHASGPFSVRDATNFCIGLSRSAHGPVVDDQKPARPS